MTNVGPPASDLKIADPSQIEHVLMLLIKKLLLFPVATLTDFLRGFAPC